MPHTLSNSDFRSDLRACRAILKNGSKSFFAASLLLPSAMRGPVIALYAFCRVADDVIDEAGAGQEALDHLRQRLAALYAGHPFDHPADRAFAVVAREYALPRPIMEALVEGFSWDANGRRYQTLEDLHAYAARVAGTVGVLMTLLMGSREAWVLSRACDLGVAMQLTNIARDIGEDARQGRLYLPAEWLEEVGIDPDAFLADPRFTLAIKSLVVRLLGEAQRLYRRADTGIMGLPAGCRPGIRAARLIYADIGTELAHHGFDSITHRAVVPTARKLSLLARAYVPESPSAWIFEAPLEAARFLIEAVGATPPPPPVASAIKTPLHAPRPSGSLGAVISIFEKLERLDRSTTTPPRWGDPTLA